MPKTVKIAISVPTEVFEEAEKLCKELKMPRSAFYAQAIRHYLGRADTLRAEQQAAESYAKHPESWTWSDAAYWKQEYKRWLQEHPESKSRPGR